MFLITIFNQTYLEKISQENNFELKTKHYVQKEINFLGSMVSNFCNHLYVDT